MTAATLLLSIFGLAALLAGGLESLSASAACSTSGSVCPQDASSALVDSDSTGLLQLQGGAQGATAQSTLRGEPPASDDAVNAGDISDMEATAAQYEPAGMQQRDIAEGELISAMISPAKKMPKPGDQCSHTHALDCLNATIKTRCPEQCGFQAELATLVKSGADTRGHTSGSKQAKNAIVSNIQSQVAKKYKELSSTGSLPDHVHDALMILDKCYTALREEGNATVALLRGSSPHATDIGYPLTVVEAILFAFGLSDVIVRTPKEKTISDRVWSDWVWDYIMKYGWDAQQTIDYYNVAIYLDEPQLPVDAGWINEFLGTLGTYLNQGGVHAYRKMPCTLRAGCNYDFSVYELPDSQPITIALLADWGSGSPQALQLLQEVKKQKPDYLVHLGDTYYSGTPEEAREFFLEPMQSEMSPLGTTVLQVPGNHDYYSEGGKGFFDVIDELGHQEASFFALRGKHFQILALDTGILEYFNLLFKLGNADWDRAMESMLPFLPNDQVKWALHQLKVGKEQGLKTIVVSHHQLFSRHEALGVANTLVPELATLPDRLDFVWATQEFKTKSEDLPGKLPNGTHPMANTRLLSQFPKDVLEGIAAWYWGHEHTHAVFEPYAGLQRGRLIGNAALLVEKDIDVFSPCEECVGDPWGGPPNLTAGAQYGSGTTWYNLAYVTVTLDGSSATARHFQMEETTKKGEMPQWGPATEFWSETY